MKSYGLYFFFILVVSSKDIIWESLSKANQDYKNHSLFSSEVNKYGITITSGKYFVKGEKLSNWVSHMISFKLRKFYNGSNIFLYNTEFSGKHKNISESRQSSCFLEFFGTIPKTQQAEGTGYLNVSVNDPNRPTELYFDVWFCLFVHSWVRREGLVAFDTIRPLFIICAPNATDSMYINQSCDIFSKANKDIELSMELIVDINEKNPGKKKMMRSQFVMKPPLILKLNKSIEELAVVATIPYLESNRESDYLISSWIYHHLNLGFRVILYDRNGSYANKIEGFLKNYIHNYYHCDSENCTNELINLTRRLTYHPYTIREILGFTDNKQQHARTDQDKALTYSHCRFEYQYHGSDDGFYGGVKSLLVIDFDEFVYCPAAENNVYSQWQALLQTVNHTKHALHADEIIFGRLAVNNISDLSICLSNSYAKGKSIFSCYAKWSTGCARHSTFKTMHHSFTCPSTDFHFACTGVCLCKRKHQGKCALFHFRPLYSGKKVKEKKTEVKFINPDQNFTNMSFIFDKNNDRAITLLDYKNDSENENNLELHELEYIWIRNKM